MTLRTQLVLVFLLLAIVPLAGIVLYSYRSSLEAVQRAEEAEAATLAREMEDRMGAVRSDLTNRIADVASLPLGDFAGSGIDAASEDLARRFAIAFGDQAPLIEQLRILSEPAEAADPPVAGQAPAPPRRPSPVVIDVGAIVSSAMNITTVSIERALAASAEEMARLEELDEGEMTAAEAEARREAIAGLRQAAEAARASRREVAAQVAAAQRDAAAGRRDGVAPTPPAAPAPPVALAAESAPVPPAPRIGRLEVPLLEQGTRVGTVQADIREGLILRQVLANTRQREGEVPFALDESGQLHTLDAGDAATLDSLGVGAVPPRGPTSRVTEGWVVVTSAPDPSSGLVFGVARPLRTSLEELRRTAARNFGWGLAMVALALFGVLPLSARLTRGLRQLTRGADRIAAGDLMTRVPLESKNELGQLARAFNRMARDLSDHQERLLQEERRRQEQETRQKLLERDVARKTDELEQARRFQLSLLPRSLPALPGLEVAARMRTATEVGGDYYDFQVGADGALTVVIGDATGHGARAGTMVTVIKSLFSASRGTEEPAAFLAEAARAIRRMDLGRMFMALLIARITPRGIVLASAGMPPLLVRRTATGAIEELGAPGVPLGSLEPDYLDVELELAPGDELLFMSDGLPELLDREGQPLGYERARELFAAAAGCPAGELIETLLGAADAHSGGAALHDDLTLVAVRITA